MSTIRTRSRTRLAGTPPVSDTEVKQNLPPPRIKRKATKPVTPPLASTRLHRLIYVLVLLTSLLGLYYTYRLAQWKAEVGGWWSLALGKRPPQLKTSGPGSGESLDSMESNLKKKWNWRGWNGRKESDRPSETVEDRINALALALGMPSRELASAIAVAVREYVPPASLSSIAAKETGSVVDALVKGAQGSEAQKVVERTKSNPGSEEF